MSLQTATKIYRIVVRMAKVNLGVLAFCGGFLCFVCFAPSAVLAQDVGSILEASSFLAKNAPLDLTRLALQVAIISMLANMVLIFAAFRIAAVWLRKPCLLNGEDGKRVLRSAVFEAVHEKGE